MSDLNDLLEGMLPGAGHQSITDPDAPGFPDGLDLEPVGVIARGGVGWVYQARDPLLDRRVAVKIARPDGGTEARTALLQEARETARLAHPFIVPVHRIVVRDGLLCVVYGLASRTTLADLLADWRAEPDDAWPLAHRVALLGQVAAAVAHAHDLGVVHGDLHPANIAVDPSRTPMVLDWAGLDHQQGRFSGTPAYAAPEQMRGEHPTPAADVHALGALAVEVVRLRPWRHRRAREDLGAFMARVSEGPALVPALDGIPVTLARLIGEALGTSLEARPAIATLEEALRDAAGGQTEAALRREAALAHVAEARTQLARFHEAERRLVEELHVVTVLRTKVPAWAPSPDKAPVWAAEDRHLALLNEQAERWTTAMERAWNASALDPHSTEAQRILAELWWIRLLMAEARGYVAEATMCERRIRLHDQGRHAVTLDARAHLSITTDAPGATAELARYVAHDRRLVPEPVRTLTLPVDDLELDPGSWLVILRAPGRRPARYPVHLRRLDHHRAHVRLLGESDVDDAWVYLPGGPFRMGGDGEAAAALAACAPWVGDILVGRRPVSSGEYAAFLDDLDPAEAREHAPSTTLPLQQPRALWNTVDGRPVLPEAWNPELPVSAITLSSARAYAAWVGQRTGLAVRLPTEEEWEKAARGVDGRTWTWGAVFDPSFCSCRTARPGPPEPRPIGSFPTDVSVYGVVDVAGGVREWTATTWGDGRAVVRGGAWRSDADDCRLAGRGARDPGTTSLELGIRLVAQLPDQSRS